MKHSAKRLAALLLAAAMVFSLLPVTALAAPRRSSRTGGVTIDVTDYGADPTGAQESSTAVIKALEYAKTLPAGTPKTIEFPKGEYHFYEELSETREWYVSNTLRWNERDPYAQKHVGILVEGMENVTIDGGGSLFMFHGNMTTVAAVDSKNVTFKNFSEDFASPEVVDVTVESHVGDNAAIFLIPACYNFTISGTNINWSGDISPVTGQPYWTANNGYLSYRQYLDTISGRHVSDGKYPFSNVSSIVKVDDTHIKVTYSNANSRPPVGQSCQMRHPNPRKTPGTFFWHSENVTVQNANFYFLHGFGMVSQLSKNITLDHVNCVPRPGTGRTSAGFADFVQMSSIGGDINITNCNFADPHDDPINVHGTFLEVEGISGNRIKVAYKHGETWGFPQYYVGDKVDFTVKNTLAHVEGSECTVTAVDNPGEGTNLDGTLRSKDNEQDMKSIIVTLDHIPDGIGTGHVMENVTYIPNVTIENCHFTEVPTRAILVTSSKAVRILNNYFDRIRTSTIFISCDAQDWRESGRTKDVLIEGNTFMAQSTANNDDHYGYSAIIMVWPTNPSNDPNYQIHSNMRIQNNTFHIMDGMPNNKTIIAAKSVNGLSVTGNRFLRYQPNVTLVLGASNATVAPGGTQATSLTTSGTSLNHQMFRLQACKDVTFGSNIYDDGLNLGIRMDETSITTPDQITDNDHVLTVGGNNQLSAVGAVTYYSDNPDVATVDANGVVTGVSGGTANITAFRTAAGRTFESAPLEITVEGTAAAKPSKIEITGDGTVDVGGTLNLTATATTENVPGTDGIAWAVKPFTDGAAATITQAGVLTATAPGVVEVTASKGGVTASKLVTVGMPRWSVVNPSGVNGAVAVSGDGTRLTLKCTSTGGDFNPDGTGAQDRYLMDTPAGDFSVSVKLETRAKTNWQEAGLVIFKDADHYVNMTSKSRGGSSTWLALISENGDRPGEPHITQTAEAIWVKLERTGTTFKGYYRVNESDEWTQFVKTDGTGSDTPTNDSLSGSVKVGLYASNSGGTQTDYSFSDFKLNDELILFNAAAPMPSVSNVLVDPDTNAHTVRLTYDYSDDDNDAQHDTIIAWYVADAPDSHYTRVEGADTDTLTVNRVTSKKWVKAVVVPRDATGRYGAPVTSAAVEAPAQAENRADASLAALSVEGFALTPAFDPNVTKYTVDVPSAVDSVTVNAAATQTSATVAMAVGETAITDGSVTLTGAATPVKVTVTAPDGTTKDYTVTIHRAQSSNVTLENLTATAGSAEITYAKGTRFYELTASEDATQLSWSFTLPQGATLEARYNGEEQGRNDEWTTDKSAFPLKPGLNSLELRVTAADGVSSALYRVVVLKNASSDASLSSLTVNGGTNLLPMTDNEAMVRLDGNTAAISAMANHYNASVRISVDGKPVNSGDEVTLTKTVSTATARVVAEDGVTEQVYTITLIQTDDTSAELYKLDLGKVALATTFDANTENYTAVNYGNAATTLNAIAAQAGAKITYETVDDYAVTEDASISKALNFYKGAGLVDETDGKTYNTVIVTVTSPDGQHTKTYTVKVEVVEEVYLSDLNWMSGSYSGWRSIQKDYEVDAGSGLKKMQLLGQNGAETFDKGLGTHANSEIYYDLSSMGFTTFTAKVGMDYSQSNTTQRLRFDVLTDDVNQYTQTDMGRNTAYATASVTIPENTDQLTLKATYTTANDSNAHADWADAKLSSTIPNIANQTDILIKHLELEHDSHTVYANSGHTDHTVTLHPVVKPVGAALSGRQRVLEWSSENTEIATVGQGELHEAIITGQKVGETTVTVTNPAKTLTATCNVTVKWKLAGKVSVTGGPRIGSTLTGALNQLDQGAKGNVDIQWWRKGAGETAFTEIAGANEKDYTVAVDKDNVGAEYKVVVTAKDGTYYDGTSESDPVTMTKLEGLPLKADPTATNASAEDATDGAITRLFKGRVYQYQKVGELNETAGEPVEDAWTTFHDTEGDETDSDGNYGTAVIDNLTTGHYVVRRAADDLHEAGAYRTVTIDVVGSQKFHVTNPNNFDGNIVQVGRTEIAEGDTMTLTVTPKEGYELVPDSLKAIEDVTKSEHVATLKTGTTNQYEVTMPNAAVTISAQFRLKTYTITHDLTNITCDMDQHDHTVTHGERFTITLTPDEGYEMTPSTITVTNADTDQPFADYTWTVDPNHPKARVLTFANGVTCNIAISGEAVRKTYTVDYSGVTGGLRAPNAPQNATHGVEFAVTLVAANGYALPETVAVTVGGAAYADFTYENGKITIPAAAVTGNIAITAVGVAQDVALQTVTLVGPARVGRVLTVNTVPVNAKVDYQWCYVEDGVATPIPDAVNARYNITAADEGKSICVKVTGKDGYAGELTSDPTAAILPEAEPFVFVETVTLEETATVAAGKTVRLTASVTPEEPTSGTLFWSSDNEAVATVDQDGVVRGVAEGVVTITAAATDQLDAAFDTCFVTVTAAVSPSRPSGGNGSTTTKTETREDGTKVTTVTKPDGTVTETVEQADGSTSETVTAKDGAVTITVTDAQGEELAKVELPAAIPAPETRFDDVPEGHWADKAIHNAAALELVKGVGDNKFDMVSPMSRGSLATVLHRLSQGKTDYATTFQDVAAGKFYTEGVAWAAKVKVVTGYTEDIFAPEDTITREQLAVMLCRYAKLIGLDTKADAKALEAFADSEKTGSWATDGVAWCVANGILQGKGGNVLDPTTNVTRAEVAVMLDRFIALIK